VSGEGGDIRRVGVRSNGRTGDMAVKGLTFSRATFLFLCLAAGAESKLWPAVHLLQLADVEAGLRAESTAAILAQGYGWRVQMRP